jgi:hypothetical protein
MADIEDGCLLLVPFCYLDEYQVFSLNFVRCSLK